MKKVTIDKVSSIINQFTIGQTLWTLSWDEPKLLEYILSRVDINIMDEEYCSITFTLENPKKRYYVYEKYNYTQYNDSFFDDRSYAEKRLKQLWNL